MKNLRIIARATLFLAVCSLWAQAQDSSLIVAQRATLNSLDSIEKNNLGFSVSGRAKSGIFASIANSDDLPETSTEYSAYTDFLLSFSVRPSNETRALFDLRFHKDWQSAYREGNNTPIITWWSYDGLILDKKLKFNLGTMRVGYTPLTMSTPNPDFIFEPQIFADMRAEAMANRYLDGSNRRLLQGLNAELNFTKLGFVDSIYVQATLARLRNNSKKMDQVFFDFDPDHDRYAAAARLGFEIYGVRLGVSNVYAFDRVRSTRIKTTRQTGAKDTIDYEYNNVLSFDGGVSSKKWLSGPVSFGLNAELAISNWMHYVDAMQAVTDKDIAFETPLYQIPCMNCSDSVQGGPRYPVYVENTTRSYEYEHNKMDELTNQAAFLAEAFVDYTEGSLSAKLSGHYLKTDIGFEAELASSPSYLPAMPILNSNAAFEAGNFDQVLGAFRSGSLENLYYSLYYTLPLNAANVISGAGGVPGPAANDQLFNNYKFAHYYRNAYSFRAHTRLERESITDILDPSVNMALPYGYATPGREGGDVDFALNWNDAVLVRGVFGMYGSEFEGEGDFTRFGGGLSVKLERLLPVLPKPLDISASYEQSTEKDGLEREAARIMAGFSAGVWRGLSLQGGVQLLDKKFGVPYGGIVKETSEMLLLGGPNVKISEKAFFVVQGGLLTNSISAVGGEKLDINKCIASANVSVAF